MGGDFGSRKEVGWRNWGQNNSDPEEKGKGRSKSSSVTEIKKQFNGKTIKFVKKNCISLGRISSVWKVKNLKREAGSGKVRRS